MTITRTVFGAWKVSALIGGYFTTRQYFFVTKSEARKAFLAEFPRRTWR